MLFTHLFQIILTCVSFVGSSYQAVIPQYGNYEVVSCGLQTKLIAYDLQQSFVYLQQAINSVGANSHSYSNSNAYKAFFNGVDPGAVTQVFQHITSGVNFSIPGTHATSRPRIICATPDAPHIWELCQQSAELGASWAINTPYIFLCPYFWQILPLAPTHESCGTLSLDSKFLNGVGPLKSGYTTLIQELTRMYFINLGKHSLEHEVNGQNGAMSLPASKSVINPTSYALYAGNIQAGCTQFPTRPMQPIRGLLESDPNQGSSIVVQLSQNCTNVDFEDLDYATCPLTVVPN